MASNSPILYHKQTETTKNLINISHNYFNNILYIYVHDYSELWCCEVCIHAYVEHSPNQLHIP